MSTLSTSRGPVPNVINFIGDHGILVVRAGGQYFICSRSGWSDCLTPRQFIKMLHMAPPSNVDEGHWGIIPSQGVMAGAELNWDAADVQAALDQWLDEHRRYTPTTNSVRPLYKRRADLSWDNMDKLIQRARAEVPKRSKVR